jgi:drug/metabolite transporter (DMT)-like permease
MQRILEMKNSDAADQRQTQSSTTGVAADLRRRSVQKKKLIVTGFALVGVLWLVAAVIPAIKGRSLNVMSLGIGVFWLILSAVVWRTPGGRAA